MDPALKELLAQTVTVEAYEAEDSYRQRTYDEENPRTLAARVRAANRKVRLPNGEEVVASTQVLLDGDPGIDMKDRITLGDGSQPILLQIDKVPDETGLIHHTRLMLGYIRGI